jgi:DUF1680 family protein
VPTIPGGWKTFGDAYEANLCCTGSGAEEYAKLVDTIYFHDDAALYVNQFVASELNWSEKDARIVQQTNFPVEEGTTLTLHGALTKSFALKIRAPRWAAKIRVRINDEEVAAVANADGYITLTRAWKAGDRIAVDLPMSLRQESVAGSPELASLAYGPLVLVACMGREGLNRAMIDAGQGPDMGQLPALPMPTFTGSEANWVRKVDDAELVFETVGQKKNFTLKPLYRVLDERYSIYWQKQA